MRTVTIVAKGPSAVNARKWCRTGTAIASINDSYKLVDGNPQYSFFSDVGVISRWLDPDRIGKLIHPKLTEVENPVGDDVIPDWYLKLREEQKVHIYFDRYCGGTEDEFRQRIKEGGICHHSTVAGAMHWLSKVERFKKIRIIGVDGGTKGTEYAPGMKGLSSKEESLIKMYGRLDFLNVWKEVYLRLCKVLHEHYGTHFEWYGGPR